MSPWKRHYTQDHHGGSIPDKIIRAESVHVLLYYHSGLIHVFAIGFCSGGADISSLTTRQLRTELT